MSGGGDRGGGRLTQRLGAACRRLLVTAIWMTAFALVLLAVATGVVCIREMMHVRKHMRPCTDATGNIHEAFEDAKVAIADGDAEGLRVAQSILEMHVPVAVTLCAKPQAHMAPMIMMLMVFCASMTCVAVLVSVGTAMPAQAQQSQQAVKPKHS